MTGVLRVSLDRVSVGYPITVNFERHLLHNQRTGKVMLSFIHEGGDTFLIYSGEVGEGEMDPAVDLKNIEIAPWQIYVFNPLKDHYYVPGDLLYLFRALEDYEHILQLDDPVQLVDLSTQEILGSGIVIGLTKFRLSGVTDEVIRRSFGPRANSLADVRKIIRCQYEVPPDTIDTVIAIGIRATSAVNLDTRRLGKASKVNRKQQDNGLVAQLIKRLARN